MKTINTKYNLQEITQKPEAYLSDLFILLYSIYLIDKGRSTPTRYSLNKLFPFIFDKLESSRELDKLVIFNLPFYKMRDGHYNKSIVTKYLKKLEENELVQSEGYTYKLTPSSKKILDSFYKDQKENSLNKTFLNLVNNFVLQYLHPNSSMSFAALRTFSHRMIVEDEGISKTVDDLETNDFKAISYNIKNFKDGQKSNLIPDQYLTLLASHLQNKPKINKEDLATVEKLLLATP